MAMVQHDIHCGWR